MSQRQTLSPQSAQEAIERGDVDDALEQLGNAVATGDDAQILAYRYTQRGDYERAIELLQLERWSSSLGAAGLRLRGNAFWHAGRLAEALHDLDGAARETARDEDLAALRYDIEVLRGEVAQVTRIDHSLSRLEWAFALTIGLLVILVIEVHRRLLFRRGIRRH